MEEFIQQQNAKLPPFDIVAERNVLASMLLDKSAVDISLEKLIASDFFENKHIEIFSTMVDMENKGIAIDYVTLQSALQEKGKLEISGGLEYLLNLTSSGVLSSNIREYVRIVSQKATLRRLIKISDEIISKSYKQEKHSDIIV